jgi:hypothetical protein
MELEINTLRAMTGKQRTFAMLKVGQTTRGFLRTTLSAEYRKYISLIRQKLAKRWKIRVKRLSSTNYEYKIVRQ